MVEYPKAMSNSCPKFDISCSSITNSAFYFTVFGKKLNSIFMVN